MIWCIYDTKYDIILEVGRREMLLQVVKDVYDEDSTRYVVKVWEG